MTAVPGALLETVHARNDLGMICRLTVGSDGLVRETWYRTSVGIYWRVTPIRENES